jgi:hypothetical protein
MPSFNEQLADKTTERALVVARAGAGSAKKIVKMMQEMERDIVSRLPEINGEMTRARLQKQLKIIRKVIADYYGEIATVSESDLAEIAKIEGRWQVYTVNTLAAFEIASVLPAASVFEELAKESLIVGNVASDWWAQQSVKLQNDFQRVVQLGLSQAETNQQITKRFKDVSGLAQRNAYALVKTATQSAAINARDTSMQANSDLIAAKVSLATLDSKTSLQCAVRDRAKYDMNNNPIDGTDPVKQSYIAIARHFNCRSMYTYAIKSFKELGLNIEDFKSSTRASMDGQIPADTTFEQFLSGKSEEWQTKYLGQGRAQLWRDGKITLSDMVSGTGRELTLDQLAKFD